MLIRDRTSRFPYMDPLILINQFYLKLKRSSLKSKGGKLTKVLRICSWRSWGYWGYLKNWVLTFHLAALNWSVPIGMSRQAKNSLLLTSLTGMLNCSPSGTSRPCMFAWKMRPVGRLRGRRIFCRVHCLHHLHWYLLEGCWALGISTRTSFKQLHL